MSHLLRAASRMPQSLGPTTRGPRAPQLENTPISNEDPAQPNKQIKIIFEKAVPSQEDSCWNSEEEKEKEEEKGEGRMRNQRRGGREEGGMF